MLRYGLLGGVRPTVPWEVFVSLGGGLFLAAVLFVLLFPLWSSYFLLGLAETGGFVVAGGLLVAAGVNRRRRTALSGVRNR